MEVASPPPVIAAFPPPFEKIKHALPEKPWWSPDCPQGPLDHLLFVCRCITRGKSQQAPKDEWDTVCDPWGDRDVTLQKNYLSVKFIQKSGQHVWKWVLRVWNNGRRNIELSQAEFTDTCTLSTDVSCSSGLGRALTGWLAKTWTKRWPTVSKLEMQHMSYFSVEEGIHRPRKSECESSFAT